MAGMADGIVEWQTEMATYVLFTVHTDDTDNDDDTLIFYSIDYPYIFNDLPDHDGNLFPYQGFFLRDFHV